jgi:hypothetical protein
MSRSFGPRLDILPAAQKRLWPDFRPLAGLGFVLYGGTAIALRLGHRTSVDFDFFTEKPLNKDKLRQDLAFLRKAPVLQDSPDTLTVLVSGKPSATDSVKVSFFGSIDFGRVGEPEQTEDNVLQVASLEDLLALKLKVILQRVEAKDYRDIEAIVKSGVRLDQGLGAARALYGSAFQPAESLKALVYFEGGDLAALPADIKKTLIDAARQVRQLPVVSVLSRFLAERSS